MAIVYTYQSKNKRERVQTLLNELCPLLESLPASDAQEVIEIIGAIHGNVHNVNIPCPIPTRPKVHHDDYYFSNCGTIGC